MSWTDGGGGDAAAPRQINLAPPPPQIDLGPATPPPTDFQQQEMQYQPPPPAPGQIVDRQQFLTWMQQNLNAGPMGAMRRAVSTSMQLGTEQDRIDALTAKLKASGSEGMLTPGEQAAQVPGRVSVGQGFRGFPQEALNAATTEIPGAAKVADIAGQVAGKVAPALVSQIPGAATAMNVADLIPGVNAQGAVSKTAQATAESLVPTQVWQAALTLLPAAKARSIPELLSAITVGDTDAITALRNAGKRLNESPAVENLLAKAGSELGQSKIPGSAERIAQLTDQQKNIRAAIKVLTPGEQSRVLGGGVRDVMSIAERYAVDSPQRSALLEAIAPHIAELPPVNQKFIQLSLETLPSKAARAVATDVQRSSQAAKAAEALAGPGSEVEKAVAGFKALGGHQAQRFTPMGGGFTDAETANLYNQIAQAWSGNKIGTFDRLNATSAINLLMTGERLPGVASEVAKPLNLMPSEIKLLGRIFGPQFEAAIPKTAAHLSNWAKFFDVVNLPRALVTAVDFSAAARQGIMLAARNPVEWGKSFAPMLKAMGSEQGLAKVGENIIKNPSYQDAVIHGLELTDIGGGAQAEEAFVSHIAARLPWVRGSERAYVAFLDSLRMLTYEKYAGRLQGYAENKGWDIARTDAVKSQVARFINHATGRGTLSGLEQFTPALNALFFAPRYFVSRPQSIWDMVRPGADKFTRQVAFENLGAFVGTGTAMLYAARLAGADVELDPRSSDFGRMKIGPTRIDFWGGYQPIARYVAQIATARTKNASTGIISFANPGDTAMRALRSKLSPLGSMIYDYGPGKQKDYAGNDLVIPISDLGANRTTGALAWNTFMSKIVPLSIQDAINGYQTTGLGGMLGAGAVSVLGGGVSSYNPTEQQQKVVDVQNFADKTLKPAGARIESGAVWPTVLDSDFASPAWHAEFQKDVPELGDLSQFKNLAELRKAYVDYWYAKQGNDEGAGEKTTKERFAAVFDKYDSVKQWDQNVKLERTNLYKAHPELLTQAPQYDVATPGAPK